jgi:hypothetical protein
MAGFLFLISNFIRPNANHFLLHEENPVSLSANHSVLPEPWRFTPLCSDFCI